MAEAVVVVVVEAVLVPAEPLPPAAVAEVEVPAPPEDAPPPPPSAPPNNGAAPPEPPLPAAEVDVTPPPNNDTPPAVPLLAAPPDGADPALAPLPPVPAPLPPAPPPDPPPLDPPPALVPVVFALPPSPPTDVLPPDPPADGAVSESAVVDVDVDAPVPPKFAKGLEEGVLDGAVFEPPKRLEVEFAPVVELLVLLPNRLGVVVGAAGVAVVVAGFALGNKLEPVVAVVVVGVEDAPAAGLVAGFDPNIVPPLPPPKFKVGAGVVPAAGAVSLFPKMLLAAGVDEV